MWLASALGYVTGIRVDDGPDTNEFLWWVSFIILPDGIGEISWHNPSSIKKYDGYSTRDKYDRCQLYANSINKLK